MDSMATFIAACIAAVAAIIAAWLAFLGARRANYTNSIVASRIRWISELRDDFSSLYSNAEHIFAAGYAPESEESLVLSRDYLAASLKLRLKLNPRDDAEILALCERLENCVLAACRGDEWMNIDREKLIPLIQQLLKREWDKSKEEAGTFW
jgi:hypothetical protein